MANIPSGIPAPSLRGYSYNPNINAARTEITEGKKGQRLRSYTQQQAYEIEWILNETQFSLFDAWVYDADGLNGALNWFTIEVIDGLYLNDKTARFVTVPAYSLISNYVWSVKGTIEVRSRATINEDSVDFLSSEPFEALEAAINRLHYVIHTVFPDPTKSGLVDA